MNCIPVGSRRAVRTDQPDSTPNRMRELVFQGMRLDWEESYKATSHGLVPRLRTSPGPDLSSNLEPIV